MKKIQMIPWKGVFDKVKFGASFQMDPHFT